MKALFFTLLIFGAAFLAYDYYMAPPWERLVFEKGATPVAANPTIPAHEVEDDGPSETAAKPADAAATKPASDYNPTIPALPSTEFTPPVLPTVEAVTKNWTSIPPQAFPRPLKIKKDVNVKMAVGSSTIRAGTTVHGLSYDNAQVTIAPTETSAARGTVALDDTDFKEQIQASFEKWKVARVEQARTAWLNAKTIKNSPAVDKSTVANGQGVQFDAASGKPAQNADGSYNLLLAVISSGQISDVDPNNVNSWGTPEQRTEDGKPTWVIPVLYKAKTIFGLMDVKSFAHVRDGRLVKWVYESGEPLP